jgi:hypothetical protein
MFKEQQLVGFLGVVKDNFKKDKYPITELDFEQRLFVQKWRSNFRVTRFAPFILKEMPWVHFNKHTIN